ncbi:hypothetical protein HanRHA438_Chr05g0234361 [Helianthus annuus]|nr:hypothetical protein HanRHA438_Chr05g0234361 [Helianthus annuus]
MISALERSIKPLNLVEDVSNQVNVFYYTFVFLSILASEIFCIFSIGKRLLFVMKKASCLTCLKINMSCISICIESLFSS